MTGLSLSGVEEAIAEKRFAPGCPFPSCSWRSMLHCYSGVAVLYLADKLLEAACSLAGVTFPSALIGLFLIVACLLALSKHSQTAADGVAWFFKPGVEFVAHRYLPIWYISALVTLPLAVQPLSGGTLHLLLLLLLLRVCAPRLHKQGLHMFASCVLPPCNKASIRPVGCWAADSVSVNSPTLFSLLPQGLSLSRQWLWCAWASC